ncbi:MAG: response regulator [Gammaproteobacteria bacterium]|nr:response regulator [Gammaproteobacteria bacterium]
MTTTVLIVDDNEMNRDVLSRRLQREGYEVSTAEDGVKALSMMSAEAYNIVLLDIMMPDMDGFETLTNMRNLHNCKDIPVIMLTSVNEMDDVKKCIDLGANDYVLKPYNMDDLKRRMEKFL